MTADTLHARYRKIRQATMDLCSTLEPEDMVVQTIPDVSPTRWHIAHVTWFFETFLLQPGLEGYREFHPEFGFLFNSYYQTVGPMHARPQRGWLSRPTVREVKAYRAHVDEHMDRLFERGLPDELVYVVEVGLSHEQQHQELMLTDIKHVFAHNRLLPALRDDVTRRQAKATGLRWHAHPGGVVEVGHAGDAWAFDNEGPRHQTLLQPFELASRPVTCGEYRAFMEDGGYERFDLWLSQGWDTVQREGWRAPDYWFERDGAWWLYTLGGARPVDDDEPVCHVSYLEADAFARYSGARLPREHELEVWAERAAAAGGIEGNFTASGALHPMPADPASGASADLPAQLFGDVWEWSQSGYSPYPGFTTPDGALAEYNGKFMLSQLVLRGGSCATPAGHVRTTYRNFFYPPDRWQFSGIRLAKDA
jgi:ergothioneine biosynthesis protein EgtB